MPCEYLVTWKCEKGHDQSHKCRLYGKSPNRCTKCANDAKKAEANRKRVAEQLEQRRKQEAEQFAHEERMAEVNANIAREQQALQDARLAEEREHVLRQKQKDLEDAAARARQQPQPTLYQGFTSSNPTPSPNSAPAPTTKSWQELLRRPSTQQTSPRAPNPTSPTSTNAPPTGVSTSASQEEWDRQKRVEGANNGAIDAIMSMIGLEDVKAQVLRIKHKIDVVKRQNARLNDERFNIVFQGNPGTGSCSV